MPIVSKPPTEAYDNNYEQSMKGDLPEPIGQKTLALQAGNQSRHKAATCPMKQVPIIGKMFCDRCPFHKGLTVYRTRHEIWTQCAHPEAK